MSRLGRRECCAWWDVWHRKRGEVVVNETHVCTIPAPRFLASVSKQENCGATNWDKENRRRNELSFNIWFDVSIAQASKIEILIRKLTMQVWNLREESQKYKGCAQVKRMKFFGKVLVSNSLTWNGNHLNTLAFIDQISLHKGTRISIYGFDTKQHKKNCLNTFKMNTKLEVN